MNSNQPVPTSAEPEKSSDRYRESEEMLLELRAHGEKLPGQTVGEYLTRRNRLRVPQQPVRFYGIEEVRVNR